MIRSILERAGRRLFTTLGALGVAMLFVGGAYATVGGHGTADPVPSPSVESSETPAVATETPTPQAPTPEEASHGGKVTRTHEGCGDTSKLEGNWTHGDYVSGIAKLRDPEVTGAAVHSDCGKPSHDRPEREKKDHRSSHEKSDSAEDEPSDDEADGS